MIPHNESPLGQVGHGPEIAAFEEEAPSKLGMPHLFCATVSSGTAALAIVLRNRKDNYIRLPTYACTALVNAAFFAGKEIELGDISMFDWNMSPVALYESVIQQTYGSITNKFSDWDIEDCTHSIGGNSFNNRRSGSFGWASVCSFGATKPLGVGQGGMVLGSKALIEAVKDYRDYDGKLCAFNFQLSDVHGKMVRQRLRDLPADNNRRLEISEKYIDALDGSVKVQGADLWSGRTWYRFVLRFKKPESVILSQAYLRGCGIETIVPLRTDELLHRKLGLDPSLFQNAEEIAKTTLSIPIFPGMSEYSVAKVCEGLKALERYV
jgi:perosamine synthetase